jgi:hypothetical protein
MSRHLAGKDELNALCSMPLAFSRSLAPRQDSWLSVAVSPRKSAARSSTWCLSRIFTISSCADIDANMDRHCLLSIESGHSGHIARPESGSNNCLLGRVYLPGASCNATHVVADKFKRLVEGRICVKQEWSILEKRGRGYRPITIGS